MSQRLTSCEQGHIGGPGVKVRVGSHAGCVHAGPIAVACVLGAATAAAALSNPSLPWWTAIPAGLFWLVLSLLGQWCSP